MKQPFDIESLVNDTKKSVSVLNYDSVASGWDVVREAMIRHGWSLEDQYNWYVGYLRNVNSEHELRYFKLQIMSLLDSIEERDALVRNNERIVKRHSKNMQDGRKRVLEGRYAEKFEPVVMVTRGSFDDKTVRCVREKAKLVLQVGGIMEEDFGMFVAFMGGDSSRVLVRRIRWMLGLKYLNWLLERWYDEGLWVETISKREMFNRASTCFCNSKGEPISADSLRVNKDIKGMAERLFVG